VKKKGKKGGKNAHKAHQKGKRIGKCDVQSGYASKSPPEFSTEGGKLVK